MSTVIVDRPYYPSLLITPENTRDRNGPVALTESGAVRRVPFDGGQAFFVEEGTTNLFWNPGLVGTNKWTTGGAGVTRDIVVVPWSASGRAMKAQQSATGTGLVSQRQIEDYTPEKTSGAVTVTTGEQYTYSITLYSDFALNGRIWVYLRGDSYSATSFTLAEFTGLAPGTPHRVSGTITIPEGPTHLYIAGTDVSNAPQDTPVYFADPQLEAKPYPTSFALGAMGEGYSWEGTPHESPSVRQDSYAYATYPAPFDTGSLYIRYARSHNDKSGYIGGLGHIGGVLQNVLMPYIYGGDGSRRVRHGTSSVNELNGTPYEPESIENVYIDWDEDFARVDWREGSGLQQAPRIYGTQTAQEWTSNVVAIGFSGNTGAQGALNGHVAALIAYDRPLTEAEIARLDSIPTSELTWNNVGRQVLRPQETELALPSTRSHVSHIETVVFETDRDNAPGVEISDITHIGVDWDIDRAGSKARIDIATHKRVLRDGMWLAPYLRITPEVGEAIYQQLGHFRLVTPSTVVDGSVDQWGDDKVEQSATGGDIVDLLAQASLPFTFYTPVDGHVMTDNQYLIKLATAGGIGPNVVANGGFENGFSEWLTSTSGTGSISTITNTGFTAAPEGKQMGDFLFSSSSPGHYLRARQTCAIPEGASYILVSGVAWRNGASLRNLLYVNWVDDQGGVFGSNIDVAIGHVGYQQWRRHFAVIPVHENASGVRLTVGFTANVMSSDRGLWDDIQVRAVTQMPLPDERINLPHSDAVATSRIQTTGGASIGYDAINADRLAAIGHHAIYTDLTGRLTTSPSRDLGSATVARTYGPDDYRLVGAFEIQRSAANRYNTVTAVKESFEEDVDPLVVTVWNNDREDAWSVHHLGNVRYPNGPLMVQDAVDESALESAAMATLARATEQRELRIQVKPDPTLAVHDVFEVIGGPEEAQGRWLVEYLRPGTSAGDPIVEIGARRSLTSVEVSYAI